MMKESNRKNSATRSFTKFYLVPKKEEKAPDGSTITLGRMVLSCRRVNEQFVRPPRVSLPLMESLFSLCDAFGQPVFTTLDYRHFFFQIPLPGIPGRGVASGLLLCDHRWRRLVGNGRPTDGVQLVTVHRSECSDGSPLRSKKETRGEDGCGRAQWNPTEAVEEIIWVKDASGVVIAGMTAWYDNVLIASSSTEVSRALNELLYDILQECQIIVKGSKGDVIRSMSAGKKGLPIAPCAADVPAFPLDDNGRCWDGWTTAEGAVDYIEVRFTKSERGVSWCHLPENVEEWRSKLNIQPNKASARDVASIIGILMWDLTVSGEPKEPWARRSGR